MWPNERRLCVLFAELSCSSQCTEATAEVERMVGVGLFFGPGPS